MAPDVGTLVKQHAETRLGRHFQGGFRATLNPGLKPWAVLYSRFRLRPISPFSYVGQVAAKSGRPFLELRCSLHFRYPLFAILKPLSFSRLPISFYMNFATFAIPLRQ